MPSSGINCIPLEGIFMYEVEHDPEQDHGPGLVPWQPLRPAPAPLPPAHVFPYPERLPRSAAPLLPTLSDADHRPGQHTIIEQTSTIRRTVAAGLAGAAVAAFAGLGAMIS